MAEPTLDPIAWMYAAVEGINTEGGPAEIVGEWSHYGDDGGARISITLRREVLKPEPVEDD